MKDLSPLIRFIAPFALAGVVASSLTSCSDPAETEKEADAPEAVASAFTINDDGLLERPKAYREWVYVGTPVTPNDMNDGKAPFPEFHNVYIDPASYDHWKEKGSWREGTVLVKELISVGSKAAVSGKGYFMGDFIGLEVTIKSNEHFPDEPGNWAYFSFTNPEKTELKTTAKAFKTADCNACHQGSAKDDFVFTQYYPVLQAAKGFGKGDPEAGGKVKATAGGNEGAEVDEKWKPSAPTPDGPVGGVPLTKAELFKWLKTGDYKEFEARESKPHPSQGPHTAIDLPVQVYMNDVVAESLAAGEKHALGSVIVKEMFTEGGGLNGWAVMVKTQAESAKGNGWFWYEVTSVSDPNAIAAIGNGVQGCAQCHSHGEDMVLTQYPLK